MSKPEPKKEEQAPRGEIVYASRDGQQVKLSFDIVRKYLVSGHANLVTDQEIMLYMGTCKARGLNPFKKDCYLVKYTEGDPAATIVSIDYFRSRAKAQPDCQGWQAGVIVADKSGEVVFRKGAMTYDGDVLLGGWFKAQPKDWLEPQEWTVPLKAYVKKTRDGRPTKFWSEENQSSQIAKVAESQGLRHVWPDEFQGLNIEGDEVIDVTPPEPIKTPRALEPKPKRESDEKANSKTTPASGVESKTSGAEPTANSESPLSQEEIAILKIDSFTKDDWPDTSVLNPLIKGLDGAAQLRIAQHWNNRKKELFGC